MIHAHKLELSLARTHFHGSNGVRAIEVLFCFKFSSDLCVVGVIFQSVFFFSLSRCTLIIYFYFYFTRVLERLGFSLNILSV